MCCPQYNSMLILHALRWDPRSGAHVHTHKCIHGRTDTQTKTPTPLLSGFYKLSFKASVRCPRAPDMVTRIQNRLSERSSSSWKTVHLLSALNVWIFTSTFNVTQCWFFAFMIFKDPSNQENSGCLSKKFSLEIPKNWQLWPYEINPIGREEGQISLANGHRFSG